MSTLIEKLRSIEHSRPGDDFPEWMEHPDGWAVPLSALCKEAADALEYSGRLQTLYDDLMASYDRLRADTDAAIMARLGGKNVRHVLGTFYKTVDVMKSARNSASGMMNVWPDDMKAAEDVVALLEGIRDGASSEHARSKP